VVAQRNVTMPMKVRKEASVLLMWLSEVDGENPSAGPQHSPHLTCALSARVAGQMMKHQCAQDGIKMGVGIRKCFDDRVPEDNLDPIFCSASEWDVTMPDKGPN